MTRIRMELSRLMAGGPLIDRDGAEPAVTALAME
jgi:hypothetical protein